MPPQADSGLSSRPSRKKLIGRTIKALRDAWLVIGLTIGLLIALEGFYRGQGALRRALRGDNGSRPAIGADQHPNAGEAWWAEVSKGNFGEGGGLRYDPFRGWWPRERHGKYINVDADGRRVTLGSPSDSGTRRTVYMLGGSSMWGWIVRDSFTVPSLVASRLRDLGYRDVEVVNLAQTTFDLAQNVATLQQEVRHGRIPAVAVFLDGNNEIAPAFQFGEVGRILNERLIARRFERTGGLGSDVFAVLRHSELVQRLTRQDLPAPGRQRIALCDAIAASYARQTRAVAAVSAAFRFEAMHFWQPMRATSNKRLTAWERGIRSSALWPEMVRRCAAAVDSAMAHERGVPYYPFHTLFDDDTSSVFTDDYGHVTERANVVIGDSIAMLVARRLGAPPRQVPRAVAAGSQATLSRSYR